MTEAHRQVSKRIRNKDLLASYDVKLSKVQEIYEIIETNFEDSMKRLFTSFDEKTVFKFTSNLFNYLNKFDYTNPITKAYPQKLLSWLWKKNFKEVLFYVKDRQDRQEDWTKEDY